MHFRPLRPLHPLHPLRPLRPLQPGEEGCQRLSEHLLAAREQLVVGRCLHGPEAALTHTQLEQLNTLGGSVVLGAGAGQVVVQRVLELECVEQHSICLSGRTSDQLPTSLGCQFLPNGLQTAVIRDRGLAGSSRHRTHHHVLVNCEEGGELHCVCAPRPLELVEAEGPQEPEPPPHVRVGLGAGVSLGQQGHLLHCLRQFHRIHCRVCHYCHCRRCIRRHCRYLICKG
mmetsp:Transcript_16771/g.37226  ORF Transcript_16771/g.37226 Transcript_16771/m.37226 type:complete len:228 (-) Transcript_16771:309-992(-)